MSPDLSRELARREEEWREIFGPGAGCSHAYHRSKTINLPALLSEHHEDAARAVRKIERQVWPRVQWRRVKRFASSRPVLVALLGLLIGMAFWTGSAWGAEPCYVSLDGVPAPGCRDERAELTPRELAWVAMLLLGLIACWLVLHEAMFPKPEDVGSVKPGWKRAQRGSDAVKP